MLLFDWAIKAVSGSVGCCSQKSAVRAAPMKSILPSPRWMAFASCCPGLLGCRMQTMVH
jgi:hypothetical protein